MSNKVGISLIVLVITIVVIIILTSAIVLNLSSSNPITKANEAVLKSNLKSVQEELSMYLSSNIQSNGTYTYPTKDKIVSANKYNPDILNFAKDKVVYRTSDINEKTQLESIGVIVDYTDGLIANYKLNGTILDSVNNRTEGTILATTTSDRLDNDNKAYNFDGVNNSIAITHRPEQLMNNGGTMAAWIYPRSMGEQGVARILDKSTNTSAQNGYHLYVANYSGNRVLFCINSGFTMQSNPNSITLNEWNHVVITFDNVGNLKIYINGVQNGANSVVSSPSQITTTNPLTIGNLATAPDRTFDGKIDDVRLYNKVLTAAEVKSLYEVYWMD